MQYPPRFIRLKMAPAYVAMDKNLFNRTVRPYLRQIPIGRGGIAFDRLELDRWADQYSTCNGRPAPKMEGQLCLENECQGSRNASEPIVRLSGTSTNVSEGSDTFQAALERAIRKKRKGIWRGRSKPPERPLSTESRHDQSRSGSGTPDPEFYARGCGRAVQLKNPPGLVIRYSDLGRRENEGGVEERSKDCPSVIMSVVNDDVDRVVLVLPITHSYPVNVTTRLRFPRRLTTRSGAADGLTSELVRKVENLRKRGTGRNGTNGNRTYPLRPH